MDALIRAFASNNDGVIMAADKGGVVNGPAAAGGDADSDGEFNDTSNGSGGTPENALGDSSD